MNRYCFYPQYKPSKLDWLGGIPNQWATVALHYVGRLKSGESITALQFNEDGEYPVYGGNGFRGNYDRFTHDGDYVLIGRQGALCGNINIAKGKFFASEHAIVVNPDWVFDTNWMGYQLLTMNLNQYSVSAAQPGLSAEVIGRLKIAFPPLDEQQAIARFLDFKTSQIDALIAKKQTLLAKLAEKRTALISYTITKGLDPSVPMKDSGVAWLGEIPTHWKKMRIKHLLAAKKGAIKTGPFGSQLHSSEMMNSEVKVFNQKTVIEKNICSGENYVSLEKFEELKAFEVFKKDLLVTTRGTIGRCMEVPEHAERGILHPCLMRLQLDATQITNRFMEILIGDSGIVLEQLRLKSNATTIEVVYSDSLKEVFVPLPSLLEQKSITYFIDEKTVQLDQQKAKLEQVIDRLKEYRSALITNAVTGKIDVREWHE